MPAPRGCPTNSNAMVWVTSAPDVISRPGRWSARPFLWRQAWLEFSAPATCVTIPSSAYPAAWARAAWQLPSFINTWRSKRKYQRLRVVRAGSAALQVSAQFCMIRYRLIPVGFSPVGKGFPEGLGNTAIACDGRCLTGPGVGAGEQGATSPGKEIEGIAC